MKIMKAIACLLVSVMSVAVSGFSAEPTNSIPRPRYAQPNGPVHSPEILADQHITFRLAAPRATEVTVMGQWTNAPVPMTRESNGLWSVTVGPIEPGIYEYSFNVDRLTMIDPGNSAIKPMREPRTSILHVPGKTPLVHDFQNVPHGEVHQCFYFSKPIGLQREVDIYTPPGYNHQPDTKFPVLFLQHGSGDNQSTWTVHGKANWIIDNLIAQGKVKPMIIVMANGHALPPGEHLPEGVSNTTLFEKDLLEEVIPYVEANYRVQPAPLGRAIVGLSMGGEQSLRIGLTHPELFAWVGGFSSAAPDKKALKNSLDDAQAVNQHFKLLWVGCGKNDFLLKRNEDFIGLLKEKKINHEWHLTEGIHCWPVWRMYLEEIAPKLFQ